MATLSPTRGRVNPLTALLARKAAQPVPATTSLPGSLLSGLASGISGAALAGLLRDQKNEDERKQLEQNQILAQAAQTTAAGVPAFVNPDFGTPAGAGTGPGVPAVPPGPQALAAALASNPQAAQFLPNLASLATASRPKLQIIPQGAKGIDSAGNIIRGDPKPVPDKRTALQKEAEALFPNDPAGQRRFITTARNKPLVTTNQEKEEDKAVGRFLGESFADMQKASRGARKQISNFRLLESALSGVKAGPGKEAKIRLTRLARAVGIDVGDLGELASAEFATAMVNRLALQNRSTADGGGLTGATSDRDIQFLKDISPGLSTTPAGRRFIIAANIKLEKRKILVAKMAREFRRKNGTIEGFRDVIDQFAETNPVFAPADFERLEKVTQEVPVDAAQPKTIATMTAVELQGILKGATAEQRKQIDKRLKELGF